MKVMISADAKQYFNCSMYYMRKYFGLREILLLTVLLTIGLLLFFMSGGTQFFMLILFGISVLIIGFAFVLFLWTSRSGYKVDFEKKGIVKQELSFDEDALHVTSFDKLGKTLFMETHLYDKLDKVCIKKEVIYIYAQISVFYAIPASSLQDEERKKLVDLLHKYIENEQTFKIKKTYRVFPKKKKITLDPNNEFGTKKDKK